MGVFEQFPYTNFHGVNLAWILEKVRDHETRISALEAWKVVTDGRLDSLETRMTAAEGDIDSLETRMTAAEGDIDSLETRVTTAEGDIDALQQIVPVPAAGDAGSVLIATGAGAAAWKPSPLFLDYDAENIPDATVYIAAALEGRPVILRATVNGYTYYCHLSYVRDGVSKSVVFNDMDGVFSYQVGLIEAMATGLHQIMLKRNSAGTPSWYAGIHVVQNS